MASDEGSSPILGNLAFRQQFEGAAEIAADLSKQNHEAEQAETIIRDPDIKEIVIDSVASEQDRTLEALSQISNELPYERLGEQYTETLTLLGEKAIELARAEEAIGGFKSSLTDDVEVVVWLKPQLARQAEVVAENKIESFIEEEGILELRYEVERLNKQKAAYEELLRIAGGAWPVPLANQSGQSLIEAEGKIESKTGDKATPPAEPQVQELVMTSRTQTGEPASRGSKEVLNNQASQTIANFLINNLNRVVAVDELAVAVYDVNLADLPRQERQRMRSHITTLLGPKHQTKEENTTVSTYLSEEKVTLMFGFKTLRPVGEGTLRSRSRPSRVYKAVPIEMFGEEHLAGHEDEGGGIIRWQITEEQKVLLEEARKGEASREQPAESVGSADKPKKGAIAGKIFEVLAENIGEPLTYEELARKVYPDSEKDIRLLVNSLQAIILQSKGLRTKLAEADIEITRSSVESTASDGRKVKLTTLISQKKTELKAIELNEDPEDQSENQVVTADAVEPQDSEDTETVEPEAAQTPTVEEPVQNPQTPSRPTASLHIRRESQPLPSVAIATPETKGVEKRRPEFKWEPTVRKRVVGLIGAFERQGFLSRNGSSPEVTISFSDSEILRFLFNSGIITDGQFKSRKLDLKAGIAAILARPNSGVRQFFDGKTPQRVLLEIIGEESKDYLTQHVA